MPTSLLSADTKFPNFSGSETTEEKVDQITNYLYMLVEQLRYSMANIGAENFNKAEFDNIVNLITEPIYFQLTSEDGTINQMLHVTEDRLISKIEGVTAGVEELGRTVTTIQQTVNSITLEASVDGNGNTSTITLTGNGIEAQSVNISFKGEVTFEALENKGYVTTTALENVYNTTTINGAYIYTGTIDACTYIARGAGESFVVKKGTTTVGGIQFDDMSESAVAFADKVYLYTSPFTEANPFGGYDSKYPSVKIRSAGRISIEAPNLANPDDLNSMPVPGGGGVYILGGKTNNYGMGEGYITLESVGIISIKQGNTVWEFKDGSLFKNYNYTSPVIP